MPKNNKSNGQLDQRYLIGAPDQVVFTQYINVEMVGLPKEAENLVIKYCKEVLPEATNAWSYPLSLSTNLFKPLMFKHDCLNFHQTTWHGSDHPKKPDTEVSVDIWWDQEYDGAYVKRTVQWGCKYFGSFSNQVVKRLRGKTEQVYIENNF